MANSENTAKKTFSTKLIAQIGMLGAAAGVLMFLEIPLAMIAPTFYKLDFSEVPVMIGGFALGPIAGVLIELIKIIIHLIFKGTQTAFVGEIANFAMGCAYVVPAALIYRWNRSKTRTHAAVGMLIATLVTTIVACFLNAYVLLPAYSAAFHAPIETFIEMGAAIHSNVNGLMAFALFIVAPFNLIKYILVSIIVLVIYKRIRTVLK